MLPNNAEQRISQRDILRRFCVALSDIFPLQKRAHPCGAFLCNRKFRGISYRAKNAPQGCARFCSGIMSLNATQKRRRISRCDILVLHYLATYSY